jgi:hypothetical protein
MNKLCETKPNSEMPKMNITNYMTDSYSYNTALSTMQKQSQNKPKSKPIKPISNPILPETKPNQTQFMVSLSNHRTQPVVSNVEPPVVSNVEPPVVSLSNHRTQSCPPLSLAGFTGGLSIDER